MKIGDTVFIEGGMSCCGNMRCAGITATIVEVTTDYIQVDSPTCTCSIRKRFVSLWPTHI